MNCHVRVREKSPKLQMVRESYATGSALPWVKVHRLPDYVYFNHQAHVTAGVSCVSCHGRVDQMVEVRQVQPMTNLGWKPEGDPAELGRQLIAAKHINPPQNCSGCHR